MARAEGRHEAPGLLAALPGSIVAEHIVPRLPDPAPLLCASRALSSAVAAAAGAPLSSCALPPPPLCGATASLLAPWLRAQAAALAPGRPLAYRLLTWRFVRRRIAARRRITGGDSCGDRGGVAALAAAVEALLAACRAAGEAQDAPAGGGGGGGSGHSGGGASDGDSDDGRGEEDGSGGAPRWWRPYRPDGLPEPAGLCSAAATPATAGGQPLAAGVAAAAAEAGSSHGCSGGCGDEAGARRLLELCPSGALLLLPYAALGGHARLVAALLALLARLPPPPLLAEAPGGGAGGSGGGGRRVSLSTRAAWALAAALRQIARAEARARARAQQRRLNAAGDGARSCSGGAAAASDEEEDAAAWREIAALCAPRVRARAARREALRFAVETGSRGALAALLEAMPELAAGR